MSESSGFRLSESEQVEVVGHLGDIVQAKIPLSIGLRALAEELENKSLGTAFRGISQDLDAGLSVEVAFANHSTSLPSYLCSMVRAGSQTGNLGRALADYANFMRMRADAKRNLQSAIVYPLVLLFAALAIVGVLMAFIVPMFKDICLSFGVELPDATRLIFRLSDITVVLTTWFPITLIVLIGVVIKLPKLMQAIHRSPFGAKCLHAIPLGGRLLRNQALAEFSQLLAMMVESRVPLPTALRLAGEGLRDGAIRNCAFELSLCVAHGQSMREAVSQRSELAGHFSHAIVSAHTDDVLVEGLRDARDTLVAQSRIDSQLVGLGLEPIFTITMGAIFFFIVMALLLPQLKMLSGLA